MMIRMLVQSFPVLRWIFHFSLGQEIYIWSLEFFRFEVKFVKGKIDQQY